MSLTLNKMFSQLDEEMQINSDDSVFDRRFYLDLIEQTRAVDLKNEYNRLRSVHPSIKQHICVPLELVDSYTCCDEVVSGCKVLRSTFPLPDTIELHQKDGIISIKPPLIVSKNINYVPYNRVASLGYDSVTSKLLYSFLYDGYLYLYSKEEKYKLIDKVVVTAIFSNPYAASQVSCDGADCLTYDDNYPLVEWMWESLTKPKLIQKLLAKQFLPKDENNNAQDDKTLLIQAKGKN
jgi:hypothetical protein